MYLRICIFYFMVLIALLAFKEDLPAQNTELRHITGDLYCLMDAYSNVPIVVNDKGILMVDAKSEGLAKKEKKILDTLLKGRPVKYLVLSHYHADQTGGIQVLAPGATLVMHANCKAALEKKLAADGINADFLSNAMTWKEGMKFTIGSETVKLFYLGSGHTCGDLVVVFETAKAIFMGGLFCCGIPPDVDVENNSDTRNWVNSLNSLFSEYFQYIVIPGQGPVSNVVNLKKFANCLSYIREQVATAIDQGKSREEAIQSIDVDRFSNMKDPRPDGECTIQKTIGLVYDEMTRKKK